MIYISYKNLITKEWTEHRQSHILWCVIRCSSRVVLKYSISSIHPPPNTNHSFSYKALTFFPTRTSVISKWFKNKVRTVWGWKPSKNKSIEPYQNFTRPCKKKV